MVLYSQKATLDLLILNICLVVVFAALRCYVRIFIIKRFWWDDWLAALTAPLFVIHAVFFLHSVVISGLGDDYEKNQTSLEEEAKLKDLFMSSIFNVIGVCLIKLSFGLTLLRIIVEPMQMLMVKIIMVCVGLSTVAFCFINIFACSPVKYFWTEALDPYLVLMFLGGPSLAAGHKPLGSCLPEFTVVIQITYAQVALSILFDTLLGIVMPILMLRRLNMQRRLKFTAGVVLALATIPSIASVVRLTTVHTFATTNAENSAKPLYIWSNVEFAWCIIATSLTTLKPLAKKMGIFKDPSSYHSGSGPAMVENNGARFRNRSLEDWQEEPDVEEKHGKDATISADHGNRSASSSIV